MVFAPFSGLKTGIDFAYFGLNSGIVFEGIRGEHEGICPFNSQRIRTAGRVISEFETLDFNRSPSN